MWLLILEALAALGLLLFIVWWTMFSGRRPEADAEEDKSDNERDNERKNGRDNGRDNGREIDRPSESDREPPPPR